MKSTFCIISVCLTAVVALQAQSALSEINERITTAKIFIQPLVWVGEVEPAQQESEALWSAAEKAKRDGFHAGCRHLEEFIAANPASPWIPSLRGNLASAYRETGRYTRALEHWNVAWESARHFTNGAGKAVGDQVLANWTRLLSSLGRVDKLKEILNEAGDRKTSDLASQQMLNASRNNWVKMQRDPGESYKCGTFALWHAAVAFAGPVRGPGEFLQLPSPKTGFSLGALVQLCAKYKLPFIALKRTSGSELIVPSVVHWRQNHYAAITRREGDYLQVVDPTFGHAIWMHQDTVNEEASGYFLVPEKLKLAGWEKVRNHEADQIFGRGMNDDNPPPPPPPCPEEGQDECECEEPGAGGGPGSWGNGGPGPGGGGCKKCPPGVMAGGPPATVKGGMPTWEIEEPEISLWLRDTPMSYQPSIGPELAIKIYYHQRETRYTNAGTFGFGPYWNANLLTYLDVTGYTGDPTMASYTAVLYGSGGGERRYASADTAPNYHRRTTLERILDGGNLIGFQEKFPNGSENTYGLLIEVAANPLIKRAFLTARKDPQGVTTQYRYSTNNNLVLLTNIIDTDGLTNFVRYHGTFQNQVAEIENPFGHIAQFAYDTNGLLTNIVDVMGLPSSFEYAWFYVIPRMIKLKTPYGDTLFDHRVTGVLFEYSPSTDDINRAIEVTEPNGAKHLWMYRDSAEQTWNDHTLVTYDFPDVPAGVPVNTNDGSYYYGLCNHNMYYRDTFYWGPIQYPKLTNTLFQLSTNEYRLARMRNWLHGKTPYLSVGKTLNMERNFAPDWSSEGEKVWYGYHGKSYHNWEGTNARPNWIARRLPNGETRYTYRQLNHMDMPTMEVSTYTVGTGYALRTNRLYYAANNVDLIAITNWTTGTPHHEWSASYNTNRQVLFEKNAAEEVTSYTYDAYGRLTSRTTAAGLTTTNEYTNGRLSKSIDEGIARTNTFTWSNGQVRTHTDERGLTITNTWDALRRLTNVAYPDGTFVAYTYSNLDVVKIVDRMGLVTQFGYDAGRRKVWELDARTNRTLYGYCACGSLEVITNAVRAETRFTYDNQGKLTMTTHGDGYQTWNEYNSIGQLRLKGDGLGSTTYAYNNQGLLAAVSNSFGRVSSTVYDFEDRATNTVDANGVSWTMTHDDLGRLLTRTPAGGGTETFTYSPRGVSNYVNQLSKTNFFAYDVAGRKTNEVNANGEATRFTYTPAGDLLTLTDGKDQVTTWKYDHYGRVTNKLDHLADTMFNYKYDANGRLTNRWTPAKGHTFYGYDPVGNLTTVNYTNSVDLAFIYDPMNRLTNMLDAVGTTRYAYDNAGQLSFEDGPWDSDTVTYGYNNRLRTSLRLQQQNSSAWEQTYGYDAARRLTSVTSQAGAFTYTYPGSGATLAQASPLHLRLSLPNGAYVTNAYDSLARLTNTSLKSSSHAVLNAHAYLYNDGNQRTRQTRTGGDYVDYGYDDIGQLKTSSGKEVGGTTNRWQEQLSYAYDAAGNLLHRTNHTLIQTFGVNNLNQLTNQSRSGRMSVAGTTTSAATDVTVNTTNAIRYADHTFVSTNHTLVNGANTFTAIAQDSSNRVDTNIVVAYLPESSTFQFDQNGSLTNDGVKAFFYDDENQLTNITVAGAWKSEFAYDGKMRRRIRKEYTWRNGAWALTNEVRYVYDGNLEIQWREANNLPTLTLTRGKDLSGSLEGAGGIGGLLARTDNGQLTIGSSQAHAYFHADGNGNITALINTQQVVVAKYLYDPFGNTLSASGPLADANLYRFSSREWHGNSGVVLYKHRGYVPSLHRWLNRDPIQERGGKNLYAFVKNTPINRVDAYGLVGLGHGIGGPMINFCKSVKDQTCNRAIAANVLLQLGLHQINGNDDKGGGNAFRHCLVACQSSKTCGEESAMDFWNGREDPSEGSGQQDLANNAVGFGNASKSSCWDACMTSWNNGELTCSEGPCPPKRMPDTETPTWDDIFPPGGIN